MLGFYGMFMEQVQSYGAYMNVKHVCFTYFPDSHSFPELGYRQWLPILCVVMMFPWEFGVQLQLYQKSPVA